MYILMHTFSAKPQWLLRTSAIHRVLFSKWWGTRLTGPHAFIGEAYAMLPCKQNSNLSTILQDNDNAYWPVFTAGNTPHVQNVQINHIWCVHPFITATEKCNIYTASGNTGLSFIHSNGGLSNNLYPQVQSLLATDGILNYIDICKINKQNNCNVLTDTPLSGTSDPNCADRAANWCRTLPDVSL